MDLCNASKRNKTHPGWTPHLHWHSACWLDVVEVYGLAKADAMRAELDRMREDLKQIEIAYLIELEKQGDKLGLYGRHDSILELFKKKNPSAPALFLDCLKWNFHHRHR